MKARSHFSSRQSKKFLEKRLTRYSGTAILLLIVLFTWGFSLVKFVNLSWFSIENVYVSGADADIADSLRAAALESVNGDYFGLFSRASSLIYPKRDIAAHIQAASPRVASLTVSRAGLQALLISVVEKAPAALVCTGLPDFADNTLSYGQEDACYFADETGYIYVRSPSFSGDVYNRFYMPNLASLGSSTSPIGSYATSSQAFSNLQNLFSELRALSIHLSAILVGDGGEYELYVRNPGRAATSASTASTASVASTTGSTDSDMAVVYMNDSRPLQDQVINLVSFWKKMVDVAHAKRESLSFEYIDVRYGSNVFYRLSK